MNNFEIIKREAVLNGIYTEDECINFELNLQPIPIHTFAMWKELGYAVKKGEHACIVTKLWRYKAKNKEVKEDEEVDANNPYYYLTKAYLFDKSQVERV